MADEKELKNAQTVYKALCDMLDEKGVRYEKVPEKMSVHFIMSGEDIPMDIVVAIDADRELIRMFSPLPFAFSEEKRVEGAIATCQANYKLVDGSFDYNIRDGRIIFRLTSSYAQSLISKELLAYMIACLCFTVDEYNDKFLMIDKGMLAIEDFFKLS